ncbi:MAG: PDZ domain-containing protein [bacterium]|nr:PDZ domain-containing protein [bacterium]
MKLKTPFQIIFLFLTTCLCLGLAGPVPCRATTPSGNNPAQDGEITLPITLVGNHILLQIKVGDAPVSAILDTGMPVEGILLTGERDIPDLNVDFAQKVAIMGASGDPVESDMATNGIIEIGSLKLIDQMVIAMPRTDQPRLHADAVIGKSIFGNYIVTIDYDDQVLTLQDPAYFKPDPEAEVLPLKRSGGFITTECTVVQYNNQELQLTSIIDIGNGTTLLLDPESSTTLVLPEKTLATRIGRGATEDIMGHVGRVKSIKLGSHDFADVIVNYASTQTNYTQQNSDIGNIGAGILKRFDITFDYGQNLFYLKPNRYFDELFDTNMSGILSSNLRNGTYEIDIVLEGSPGSLGGLEPGDIIVKINHQPSSEVSNDQFGKLLRSGPGKQITLGIERDGVRHDVEVTLQRMI